MRRLPVLSLTVATVALAAPPSSSHGKAASTSASASTLTVPQSVSASPTLQPVSTEVASPTAPLSATLPSQVPLPPHQAWCPSEIFCAGDLLQTVNIAQLYADPKTFVDKPTNKSSKAVLADFAKIVGTSSNSSNVTEGSLVSFVNTDFRGEGGELAPLDLGSSFNPSPKFLAGVSDPLVRAWTQIVHGYWTQLIRTTNKTALCDGVTCESTLVPLNHTFVVPGGRFREQYYWDSYWIVEGLLESELFSIANATLQNFMDEIERFGFIPNGGRIYYLNRSQPPVFIWMLSNYVAATNDTSILTRALPLAERELAWWDANRSLNVTSPTTNKTYAISRYAVTNTAPRPESYLTDYLTANDPAIASSPLTEDERAELYSELASGAETGWDYSTRFIAQPLAGGVGNTNPALRALSVKNHVPVDLNSILYKAHAIMNEFYSQPGPHHDTAAASRHAARASALRAAILDLLWSPTKLAFYDFNLTSHSPNDFFSAATFYPLWAGIVPPALTTNASAAQGFFASVRLVLSRYNGTFPATFVESGLQWDAPNAWPPHQYVALQALNALPENVSGGAMEAPPQGQSTFALVPEGQLGIVEAELPVQTLVGGKNASVTGAAADVNVLGGTVVNGGNASTASGWRDVLARQLANRYVTSALCSWHSTGGEVPGMLPRLSDAALNVSGSVGNTGNMFEKFSIRDIDVGGSGGEYTVQAGFGWTNGVALWVAAKYGDVLVAPACPNPLDEAAAAATASGSPSASAAGSGATGASGGASGSSARTVSARTALIGAVAAAAGVTMIAGAMDMLAR